MFAWVQRTRREHKNSQKIKNKYIQNDDDDTTSGNQKLS